MAVELPERPSHLPDHYESALLVVAPSLPKLTGELVDALIEHHLGEWVAIDKGRIVAHGPTLGSLVDQDGYVYAVEPTIMRVPLYPTRRFDQIEAPR